MRIERKQLLQALALCEGDKSETYSSRRNSDLLVATEHGRGLSRAVIHADGSFKSLGSGIVSRAEWCLINLPELDCPDVHCELCGAENAVEERSRNQYGYRRFYFESTIRFARCRGMYLCAACAAGYDSGEYAAVGVAHELRGCRLGHAFDLGPGMAPLNSRKLPGPTFNVTRQMTLDAILKAHAAKSEAA